MSDEFSKEAAKNVSKAIGALLSVPAKEFSELLADQIRYYRWRSLVRIAERARQIRSEKNITNEAIPLKILLPILEEGSKETEDSDLCESWARLLANANSKYNSFDLACIEFLKKITSDEAQIIEELGKFGYIETFRTALLNACRDTRNDWLERMAQLPAPASTSDRINLTEADRREFRGFVVGALEKDLRHCWRSVYGMGFENNVGMRHSYGNEIVRNKRDVFFALKNLGLVDDGHTYKLFPDFSVCDHSRSGWTTNGKWAGSHETFYVQSIALTEIGTAFWNKMRCTV